MPISEIEPPFCRLYVDAPDTREAVQELLGKLLGAGPAGPRILVSVSPNDGYEPSKASSTVYDPITASAWTAELDAELPASGSHEPFRARVVAAIREARARGMIVTASCDFEDRVAAETGWNWSTSTPEPPIGDGPLGVTFDGSLVGWLVVVERTPRKIWGRFRPGPAFEGHRVLFDAAERWSRAVDAAAPGVDHPAWERMVAAFEELTRHVALPDVPEAVEEFGYGGSDQIEVTLAQAAMT